MNNDKWDTATVMGMGVLSRPTPQTDIPYGRETYEEGDGVAEAIEAGKLATVPEYYGIPFAWKDDRGYHGRLLQYRNLTEAPDFETLQELVEWYEETLAAVTG